MKSISKKILKLQDAFIAFQKLDAEVEELIGKVDNGLTPEERDKFIELHDKKKQMESQLKSELNSTYKAFGFAPTIAPVFNCEYKEIIEDLKFQYNSAVQAFYKIGIRDDGSKFFTNADEQVYEYL